MCCGRSRSRVAPRSRSSATPTTSPSSCSPSTSRRASTGSASACSRWSATCSARSAGATTSATSRRRWRQSERSGLPTFNLDVIYGAAGERLVRLADDGGVDSRPRSAARLGVRPDDRSRHAARHPARAASRRRRPGRQVRVGRRRASPPPGSRTTRSRTGPAPGTSAGTTSSYWRQQDYRGFGCAAHSHRAGRRWWNVRTPDRYIELVEQHLPTEASGETLDDETRRIEGLAAGAADARRRARRSARRRAARRPGRARRRPLGAHPPRPPARQRDLVAAALIPPPVCVTATGEGRRFL